MCGDATPKSATTATEFLFEPLKPLVYDAATDTDLLHQEHYTGEVEPIDLIRSLGIIEEFCAGNIIKYVSRYRKKNGLEDLEKARVYLDWLIEELS